MNFTLPKNWKTTLGGILAGAPAIITASGFEQSPHLNHWLNLCSAVGMILLGASAKDWNTHSTTEEVAQSTVQAAPESPKV